MAAARESLKGEPTLLSLEQRAIVESAIRAHCRIKGWTLHAVNVRTNHVHVVVTADGVPPELVVQQFKAWASRHLGKQRLWTRHRV